MVGLRDNKTRGGCRPKYLGAWPLLFPLFPSSSFYPPLTFPFLPFLLLFLSSSLPALPLEVGTLKYSQWVWGSAVSSLGGVWGGAPAEIEFCAFLP